MGLFGKLFGSKPQYEPLPDDSEAARQLESLREPLVSFAGQTSDDLELVPADREGFIFIGSPPKRFGIVWIDSDGKINNFKTLAGEKGVSAARLQDLVQELSRVYQASSGVTRYSTSLEGRPLTVTPNSELAARLRQVIDAAG